MSRKEGMKSEGGLQHGMQAQKKIGDASLHPRRFSFNLTEEFYLFFFLAFAFGFALAFAFGFAFAFAFAFGFALAFAFFATAILFSSQTL